MPPSSASESSPPRLASRPAVARKTAWKLVASVSVAVVCMGGLLYASARSDLQYYRHVDEVVGSRDGMRGKRLQVHGNAVAIYTGATDKLDYKFTIESRPPRSPARIEARYHGVVPDTFKDGSEVVASGTLAPDGSLAVTQIDAKCPSKYNAATAVSTNKY